MNKDFFVDEKPKPEKEEPGWHERPGPGGGGYGGGGGGVGGGGGWWAGWAGWVGGGGGGGEQGEWEAEEKQYNFLLKISAGGRLMWDAPKGMIGCPIKCEYFPPLIVFIRGETEDANPGAHTRCALFRLDYKNNCGRYTYRDVPRDESADLKELKKNEDDKIEVVPAYIGGFPLCEPEEEIELLARWQKGHWERDKVRDMHAYVFGIDLGWSTVPWNSWRKLATIRVDKTFHIRVNGISAKLCGNKYLCEEKKSANH